MEPSLSALGLKALAPAVLAGYRAYSHELARQIDQRSLAIRLSEIDDLLDEALSVLAREADSLWRAVQVEAKGWVSRPDLFNDPVPRAWIETAEAQRFVKLAARAAVRGDDDAPHAAGALAHYALIAADDAEGSAPDGGIVYATALEYLLASLRRGLTPGDRMILGRLEGLDARIAQDRDTDGRPFVDAAVREQLVTLRAQRFFRSANVRASAAALAGRLIDGPFAGASGAMRVEALAWCARILAFVDAEVAQAALAQATALALGDTPELRVARALIAAADDFEAGLVLLDNDGSPLMATAALQILRRGLGAKAGLERAAIAGITLNLLDSDGRCTFITASLETGAWDDALTAVRALVPDDFETTPALLWLAGTLLVAVQLPEDLRHSVLQDVPANPALQLLPDDPRAIAHRALAISFMERVSRRCDALDLSREAAAARRYALWLELHDPERRVAARERLHSLIDQPGNELASLPLALAFGLDVDRTRAADAIARERARGGALTPELVNATVALLLDLASEAPDQAAEFLDRHRELLTEQLDPASLIVLEARILQEAGRAADIPGLLASEQSRALTPALRRVIVSSLGRADGEPDIAELEAAWEEDPQTGTLLHLMRRYRELPYDPRFMDLARRLLSELANSRFALESLSYLAEQGRDIEALELLALLGAQVEAVPALAARAAWVHYRLGAFDEAQRFLDCCGELALQGDMRALRYQLLLASGRWEALDTFLEEQWRAREALNPAELTQGAHLAAQLGSSRVAAFVREAVRRAPDDPNILMAAYGAVTQAGLEEELEEAGTWIMRAAEHSGPDGPVQSLALQDLISGQPEWEARVETAWRDWARGALPLAGLALMLRRPWLELHLTPLLVNLEESAARRRASAMFSGRRRIEADPPTLGTHVAIERSALVTLAACDALEAVLAAFDRVHLAHDTLTDLYDQRTKIVFHQPSKIAFAHQLAEMLARGRLRAFTLNQPLDPLLAPQIGHSLAALLSEAAAQREGQHVVIHPWPITRAGSLLNDPVQLDDHASRLASCSAVVDLLERKGLLTQSELARARGHLGIHEKRWPAEPQLETGATLYLSDLSVDYLRYVGLLGRIEAAGLDVLVSASEIEEASALRDHERLTTNVSRVLETLRGNVTAAMAAGRIVFEAGSAESEGLEGYAHGMSQLAAATPVLVTDDRCINRHAQFEHASGPRQVLTSLDLLDLLAREKRLSPAVVQEARVRLQRAGAMLILPDHAGLLAALAQSSLHEGGLRETGELRALRENIRIAEAGGWFEPAVDVAWLVSLQELLGDALVAQWCDTVPDDLARARSAWLLDLLSSRDWVDTIVEPRLEGLAVDGPALDIAKLLGLAREISGEPAARYAAWLQEDVIGSLTAQEPRVEGPLYDRLRALVRNVARDLRRDSPRIAPRTALRMVLAQLPDFVQIALMRDPAFSDEVGQEIEAIVTVGEAEFVRSVFLRAVSALYAAPERERRIRDMAGRQWTLATRGATQSWALTLRRGKQRYRTRALIGLHPDADVRVALLERQLGDLGLRPGALAPWISRLRAGMLDAQGAEELDLALASHPGALAAQIAQSLPAGAASIGELVPDSRTYFETLAGPGEAADLEALARDVIPAQLARIIADHDAPHEIALRLAAHPLILADGRFGEPDWTQLTAWALRHADPMSKVGLIELALPHAADDEALTATLVELIGQVEAYNPEDEQGSLHLFSSLAIFIEGELSRAGTLHDWPPFRRRLASLSQAALITRIVDGRIDTRHFAEFCLTERGWRFVVQSLADLRTEPRWRPEFLGARQLRNEFLGRIVNAAGGLPADALPAALAERILGPEGSVRANLQLPMAFWPGPLEGTSSTDLQAPPDDIAEALDHGLAQDNLTLDTLTILVNVAAVFRLPEDLASRAAARIDAAGAALLAVLPQDQIHVHLLALAHVAATHRLPQLARGVQRLARVHRAQGRERLEISEALQLALFAAAAHEATSEWRRSLGEWISELARHVSAVDDVDKLLTWIETLCAIDPVLRTRVARSISLLRLKLDR